MSSVRKYNEVVYLLLEEIVLHTITVVSIIIEIMRMKRRGNRRRARRYTMIGRIPDQIRALRRLVGRYDSDCFDNLRMDRNTFGRLCILLRNVGGLVDGKYVSIEEQVSMFLCVLAHHKKNRVVRFDFIRSGQTVSHYVHQVLCAVLQLHNILLAKPVPVPDDSNDPRWKWFKGCLGALDGTYISVHVPVADRGRYRTRRNTISTNVLACCDQQMQFSYVLAGWEGSASDARVLRDAVNRVNGLKVPTGTYYLCDNGYANSPGFLSPYRSVRYHLDEWGPAQSMPINKQEHFNMRHTRARNIIERAFGVLKKRWGIFSSTTFYPIKTQIRLIMACFLLHNFIRNEMRVDPIDALLDDEEAENDNNDYEGEYVETVGATTEWNAYREQLANNMWVEYNGH